MKIAILTCPFEPPKPKGKHKVRGKTHNTHTASLPHGSHAEQLARSSGHTIWRTWPLDRAPPSASTHVRT